jgi:hypothetical protein
MRSSALVAAFAFVLVALAAVTGMGGATGCTLSVADSGSGDSGSQTVGTQCSEIASAFCGTYAMCGISDQEPADCIENTYAGCCAGTVCNETSQTSADAVEACVDAFTMSPDCNAFENTMSAMGPSACSGIPQP